MSGLHITDYSGGAQPPPDGPSWTTAEMQRDFEPLGFSLGYLVVKRRSDGVKGSLHFTHNPRVYFGFMEASDG